MNRASAVSTVTVLRVAAVVAFNPIQRTRQRTGILGNRDPVYVRVLGCAGAKGSHLNSITAQSHTGTWMCHQIVEKKGGILVLEEGVEPSCSVKSAGF
jgi:hypothetical protein